MSEEYRYCGICEARRWVSVCGGSCWVCDSWIAGAEVDDE